MNPTSGSSRGSAAGDEVHAVLALGVDGGGTKTEAWLARFDAAGEPIVLGRGRAGSSNPRAMGLEKALANLKETIDAAWRDAKLNPAAVDCAVLAISGAGRPEVRQQISAWVEANGLARQVCIEHDAEPVLAAGTPDGWGVGLIVGTGSAAIAADRGTRRHVVGGWGYWFGDEGGAYWLGRHALMAVARASDGRGAATSLTRALTERLQIDDPRAMLGALEKSGDVRSAIAGLADMVLDCAVAGDAVANEISDRAARELATLVACAAKGLGLGREFPLALTGGVACGSELLRERLLAALEAQGVSPSP